MWSVRGAVSIYVLYVLYVLCIKPAPLCYAIQICIKPTPNTVFLTYIGEGSMDAGNLLKPMLARGELQVPKCLVYMYYMYHVLNPLLYAMPYKYVLNPTLILSF
jgi:hypothetical protein